MSIMDDPHHMDDLQRRAIYEFYSHCDDGDDAGSFHSRSSSGAGNGGAGTGAGAGNAGAGNGGAGAGAGAGNAGTGNAGAGSGGAGAGAGAGNAGTGNAGAGSGGAGAGAGDGDAANGGTGAWTFWSPMSEIFTGLLIAVLSTVLVMSLVDYHQRHRLMTPQSTTTDRSVCPRSQMGDCHWIPTPASSTRTFPLPFLVDELVHKVVLNEIGWSEPEKLINNLILQRSLVISRLNESVSTIQLFVEHLAHTRPKDKTTFFALTDNVNLVQDRLDAVIKAIDALDTLYASMKSGYDELTLSSTEALRKVQWSHMHRTLIKTQPVWTRWLGMDLYNLWGVAFKQKLRKVEEARSGVTALNRESQRIRQIKLVVRELRRIAGVLETSVIQWSAEFIYNNLYDDGIGQERLRVWFRQNVYENPQLVKLWDELFPSVNEEEEGLLIEFTTEWCGS